MLHLLACLFILKFFYIRRYINIYVYFGLHLGSFYIIAPPNEESQLQLQGSYVKLPNENTTLARHYID